MATTPRGQLHLDQETYDRIGEVASILDVKRVQVVRDAVACLERQYGIAKDVTRRLADRERLQDKLSQDSERLQGRLRAS